MVWLPKSTKPMPRKGRMDADCCQAKDIINKKFKTTESSSNFIGTYHGQENYTNVKKTYVGINLFVWPNHREMRGCVFEYFSMLRV